MRPGFNPRSAHMCLERQLRYYLEVSTEEQNPTPHHWIFYIQNTKREATLIQERILEELAMCNNLTTLESGIIIPKLSIIARLIEFDSQKGKIENQRGIYNSSNFKKDRNLKRKYQITEAQFVDYYTKFLK